MKNTRLGERRTISHLPPPKVDDFTKFPERTLLVPSKIAVVYNYKF